MSSELSPNTENANADSNEGEESSKKGTTISVGQIIKPYVSIGTVKELVFNKYGMKPEKVKELNSYDDKNYYLKVEAGDIDNPHLEHPFPAGYVFKILNSYDSNKTEYIDAQHAMMRYLFYNGINCPQIIPNLSDKDYSIEKLFIEKDETTRDQSGFYLIRMFNYLPGITLGEVKVTPDLCYQAGQYIGTMDKYLLNFNHKGLEGHKTIWSLESVPKLTDFSPSIRDPKRRELSEAVIAKFSQEIVPKLEHFKRGVIHGDFNEHNIIVQKHKTNNANNESFQASPLQQDGEDSGDSADDNENTAYDITGVIDFGDVHISYYIFEIALCITYMMIKVDEANVLDCGGYVLAGYLEQMELSPEELFMLQLCICGRLAQSLTMGEYTYSLDPGNEYLLTSAKRGWHVLDKIWNADKDSLYNLWDEIIVAKQNEKYANYDHY